MSEEELRASQYEEVEAIKSMYLGDVEAVESGTPQFTISLYPQRGSSGGGAPLENITFVKLHVVFPPMYPKVIPKMTIQECKGLSAQEIQELSTELKKKAEENIGEVMMYPVLLLAEEFLYAHQKKPTGSFHDEMVMRNKLLQERNLQMQMMFKERERLAIKEEILRKQEEMKEEQRRRRELWKSQQSETNSYEILESSPTKSDSFSGGIRPSIIGGRRKRRSISCRRRRSNSEGSDSSLSEGSDLVMLEFVTGKSVQYYYKGEVIGRSNRGSTVYAGISKSGSLVAIYEWRYSLPVDRKGRPVDSGNDALTIEGLTKQLQSLETESNFLQKLEHSNTILYYGMKIFPAADEAGVVYLYLVEEFVRGHTVRSYLQDPQQLCSMALPLLRHITNGVLEALKFLHDNNIAHRSLRDTSIFLDVGDEIKVCDYGIERKAYELYKLVDPTASTDDRFPPSIGRGGKKGDIYRLGLIVLSLLKGKYVEGPEIPQTIPDELQDFLKRCLSTLENNRGTATELLEHPFLKMAIKKGPNIQLESPELPKEDEGSNDDADPVLPPRIASTIPFSLHSRLHNEFQVLEWLGKGGFGDVLKVRNKLDSRIYALKRIKLNPRNKQLNKKITREVKLLSQLNHENVVRYFNSWIETVEEDDTTEASNTESMSTEPTTPEKKVLREPSVRFQLDKKGKFNQNSLGMFDNIEDLAPPMKDSEWSISIANDGDDDADDSEDSSDEVDLFGTSFLRLTNDDSEAVIFESDNGSARNGTSETDTAEESSRSKRFNVEISQSLNNQNDKASPDCLQLQREIQYMYIQMEFCEKSTLRTAIDDNLYEDTDRAWRLFREIVEGLVHIHQQGMIHRDLKPVNIFLDSHDHVKIGDFGLATSSILPKLTAGDLIQERQEDPQSVDFPDESQTGQVGTALYVAPELITKATKVSYNQKVDIYSLGIILFEMFYRPLPTAMERVRVITALRQSNIVFPKDFDEHLMPQITHMSRWLLNHDPATRPTSLELLQSDYLPPPHLEEAELRDIFSRTLKNSQSKAYKFLIASCFLQKVTPVENFTFDMENTRFPPSGNYLKCYHFLHKLKQTVQNIFEKHGGIEIQTPILMPKSEFYEDSDTAVNMMCHSGNIVSLPHDLRIPFARYVGRHNITHMKRYSIEKVFRERKIYGLHPRELVECAFDIVDCTPGSLIADAEIISIALEVIQGLPWLKNKTCTIRLGHTKLLEGLLIHHCIDTKYHDSIKKTLSEIKVDSTSSKSQIQTYLCSRGLPEHFITMLFALMEVEGSLPKVSNILKSITKRKSEAASLIKAGLHELEILKNNLEHLGLKCGLAIVPTMVFGSQIYSGLLFQVVCHLRRRKNKITVDVIAAGGRYDALLESFRSALALETDPAAILTSKDSQYGVGISISFDKLVAAYDGEDCAEWNRVGTRAVDTVICSVGHTLSKEKLELMKELWSHKIKCTVLECSQTLEATEEQCKEMGAMSMIILKENEFYSSLRVKTWEKEMFQERKMSRQEAVKLISERVGGHASNESQNSSSNVGINRSESLSTKTNSTSGTDSNSNSLVANNAGLPLLGFSFVVQEKEKLANWKKRYENQVMHHITDVLPKLAKQQHIEVFGLDVNSSVINTLAACLVSSDKDEFYKGVSDVIEKHPRLRKYLQNVCDEIYELWFEKSASVTILYGLLDNSYRVLL